LRSYERLDSHEVQEVPWKEPEMEEAGARKVAFSDISCFVLFFVQAPSSEPFANGECP